MSLLSLPLFIYSVQHEVVSGLKYLQVVKRKGVRGKDLDWIGLEQKRESMILKHDLIIVDKTEEMIGSYGPAPDAYEKKFQLEEAPSGLLARGHYDAKVNTDLSLAYPFY